MRTGAAGRSARTCASPRRRTASRSAPPWPSTGRAGSSRSAAACEGSRLMLLDPDSLDVLAGFPLPPRKPGTTSPLQDLCGGAYFYLDDHDRAVIETTNAQVWVVSQQKTPAGTTAFHLDRTYDVSSAVPDGDCLIALMPDWKGRIWFVTQQGGVGNVAPGTGVVRSLRLPGEKIVNSFATDETGGVFVASDHALYRFDADAERPAGQDVAAALRPRFDDQARSAVAGQRHHADAGRQGPGGDHRQRRPEDERAVLPRARSHTCRSGRSASKRCSRQGRATPRTRLVAVGRFGRGRRTTTATRARRTRSSAPRPTPGLARVDVTAKGCGVMWTSHESAPSSVAKASLASGLLYAYTKPPASPRTRGTSPRSTCARDAPPGNG